MSNHKNKIECLKSQKKLVDEQIGLLERQLKRMEDMSNEEIIKLEKQRKMNERKAMMDEIERSRTE